MLSGEGPTTKQRTGDALVSGKLRLAGLAPPSGPGIAGGDGNTRAELYLWHYFGDPTMQMWGGGGNPIIFNPNIFKAIVKKFPPPKPGDPPPFLVEITLPLTLAGQPFSLLRNGEVIGKAIAGGDGTVQVPALINDGDPQPGELKVALDADGAAPVQFGVDGTLTQSCPKSVVFNGNGSDEHHGHRQPLRCAGRVDDRRDVPGANLAPGGDAGGGDGQRDDGRTGQLDRDADHDELAVPRQHDGLVKLRRNVPARADRGRAMHDPSGALMDRREAPGSVPAPSIAVNRQGTCWLVCQGGGGI